MKILSEGEFRNFSGFVNTGKKEVITIENENTSLTCTKDHKILKDDGEWIEAGEIDNSHAFGGMSLNISPAPAEDVYDVVNVQDTHSFYTNGLTAHNCLMLDEFAFIDNFEEFYSAVLPTITAGKNSKIIVCTTPNGLNHAYKFWEDSKAGRNNFNRIFVPWWKVPGRDEAWKTETLQLMGGNLEKFAQEQEVEFLGSSGTLISGAALKNLVPLQTLTDRDGLKQYHMPVAGHSYIITADVSRGKQLDYSAFSVIDVTAMPYQQVCVYRNNMVTPLDYANTINNVAKLYNNASVLVEINDIGGQVADSLWHDYELENLIHTENGGMKGKRITGGYVKGSERGIRTTKTVKNVGCSILKLLVESQQLVVNDQDSIYELSRFSRKGTSYEAESGATDDLVMGLVLFAWISDQQYFKELTDINTLQKLREKSDEEIEQEMVPFGFIDYGYDEHDKVIDLTENPYNEEFNNMFF